MMKHFAIAALFATLAVPVAFADLTAAQVERCEMLGQTFAIKKANVARAEEARDVLAAEAEALGEAWENAEAVRNFGNANAAEADAALVAFEDAKKKFNFAEQALRSQSRMLAQDAAVYNSACVQQEG